MCARQSITSLASAGEVSGTTAAFRMLVAAVLTWFSMALQAEAPRGYIARPLESASTYSQRARDAYDAGVWTLDEIAASDAEPGSMEGQAIFRTALRAFEEAVEAEPSMYEAHTYLGYVHRNLGDFDASLRAYEIALKLKPDFAHAIEYQGEAYLSLGDFDRARFNYLRLYALDQALAAKLFDAMHRWTASHARSSEVRDAQAWVAAQVRTGTTADR